MGSAHDRNGGGHGEDYTTGVISMPNHRKGFSLVEVTIVGVLMATLGVLLSSAWVGVGKTAVSLIGRSRLVQERDLAVAALSRDLGGSLADPDPNSYARKNDKATGRWLRWENPVNALLPSNKDLKLFYDGETTETTIRYLVMEDPDPDPDISTLILVRRENETESTDFTVAKNVYSMNVTLDPDNKAAEIVLCFQYSTLTLTCDLTAKQPSVPSGQTLPWSIIHYTNP